MTYGKLRRVLARIQTFQTMEVVEEDSVISYKQIDGKSAPKWIGPAVVLDIDDNVCPKRCDQIHAA